MLKKWASRKLVAAIVAMLSAILTNVIGLPEAVAEHITTCISGIAMFYIAGQSAVDVAEKAKEKKKSK